jgi:ribosomal protein S12 methylthiotransferase accessory factor YcaO
MSALFFRISLQANVDRFRALQAEAKARGFSLTVKNTSRTRGIPCFLFYLDRKDGNPPAHSSDLDAVAATLGASA